MHNIKDALKQDKTLKKLDSAVMRTPISGLDVSTINAWWPGAKQGYQP